MISSTVSFRGKNNFIRYDAGWLEFVKHALTNPNGFTIIKLYRFSVNLWFLNQLEYMYIYNFLDLVLGRI